MRAFHAIAIAIAGGVSRATRRHNVSQPTLSQQWKALDARHAITLFESREAPLRPPQAGRDLFAVTNTLFATAGDIVELLGEPGSLGGGVLRLGSDDPTYTARLVHRFRHQHPHHEVQVRIGNAREVMRWLGEAQIDAASASDPPGDASFSYQPLASTCCSSKRKAGDRRGTTAWREPIRLIGPSGLSRRSDRAAAAAPLSVIQHHARPGDRDARQGRAALARGVHQRELTGLTAAARGGIGIIPTRRG